MLDLRQSISACSIGAMRRQEEILLDQGDMWSETWEEMIEREKDRNSGKIKSAGTCQQQNGWVMGALTKIQSNSH